jgi:hypothetical protein
MVILNMKVIIVKTEEVRCKQVNLLKTYKLQDQLGGQVWGEL